MKNFKMNTWYHATYYEDLDWAGWSLGSDENKWFTFNNTSKPSIIKFVYPVPDWRNRTDKKIIGSFEKVYIICKQDHETFFVYHDQDVQALKCRPIEEVNPNLPLIFNPTSENTGFLMGPVELVHAGEAKMVLFNWTNENYKRPLRVSSGLGINLISFKEVTD